MGSWLVPPIVIPVLVVIMVVVYGLYRAYQVLEDHPLPDGPSLPGEG
jgi:hypothetical protein